MDNTQNSERERDVKKNMDVPRASQSIRGM